jgi:hypothetical protein
MKYNFYPRVEVLVPGQIQTLTPSDFAISKSAFDQMPVQLATLQLATLQLATKQLVTLQLATLQLATITSRHLATRHHYNSPP